MNRSSVEQDPSVSYLGQGIYGIAEAARLLRRPQPQVRRWANGYSYQRTYDRASLPAVLQTVRSDKDALTFRELIELFFVREYTHAGISLQHLRDTAKALAADYGEHPFATKKLLTDGKQLLSISDYGLIAPATCQLIAEYAHELVKEFEFEDDFVDRWHPKEGGNAVVINPARAFGEPILLDTGTPTRTIFRTFQVEQDFDRVGEYYEITTAQVRQAVGFELRFADAA